MILLYTFYNLIGQQNKNDKDNKDDTSDKNPFAVIGIDELNPKKLLTEIENENKKKYHQNELNSIEDLPEFLKTSRLSDEELMEVLSRFLMQDDINLKKFGAIYDKTGFDGCDNSIKELPADQDQRNQIKARSAASLFVNYNKLYNNNNLHNYFLFLFFII